jgi:hypothetical protein
MELGRLDSLGSLLPNQERPLLAIRRSISCSVTQTALLCEESLFSEKSATHIGSEREFFCNLRFERFDRFATSGLKCINAWNTHVPSVDQTSVYTLSEPERAHNGITDDEQSEPGTRSRDQSAGRHSSHTEERIELPRTEEQRE